MFGVSDFVVNFENPNTLSKFEIMWTEDIDNSKTLYQVKSNYSTFYCIFYLVYFNPLLCSPLLSMNQLGGVNKVY